MHSSVGHILIFVLPVAVIAGFALLAFLEKRRLGSSAPMSFLQRNGIGVSTYLVAAVGLWTVFMIVLPQLYMVDLSFRPKLPPRSEDRRVGNECVSPCRSRGWPCN